jgi:hypothetical protein
MIAASGYSQRTARDARSTLTTVLGDAIPRHIQANPSQRRRGKGRKGQRRMERIERTAKAWPTPLEALLLAERCAALSGHDTDFIMVVTLAYTAMRWSEIVGLTPPCVHSDRVDISWKLYELNGRFRRGRPKDGSVRRADLPPILLARQLTAPGHRCTCRSTDPPWCLATTMSSSVLGTDTFDVLVTASGSSGRPPMVGTRLAAGGRRCLSWRT